MRSPPVKRSRMWTTRRSSAERKPARSTADGFSCSCIRAPAPSWFRAPSGFRRCVRKFPGEMPSRSIRDQVQLQAQRGEILAHLIVEELGEHVALEFLGLQRAQHGVAQFLLGRFPGRDLAGQCPGIAVPPSRAPGKRKYSRCQRRVARADKRLAGETLGEAATP